MQHDVNIEKRLRKVFYMKKFLLSIVAFCTVISSTALVAMHGSTLESDEIESGYQAYHVACQFVKSETKEQIKAHFNGPLRTEDGESLHKNALRFAYAVEHRENIDEVKCCEFLRDCKKYWINTPEINALKLGGYDHELLAEKYLKYTLPLLEPVLKERVTVLHLASSELVAFPKNLKLLTKLKYLDLYSRESSVFGLIAPGPKFLPLWLADISSLKKIVMGPQFLIGIPKDSGNPFKGTDVTFFICYPDGQEFKDPHFKL